jgi:hypothetical protein
VTFSRLKDPVSGVHRRLRTTPVVRLSAFGKLLLFVNHCATQVITPDTRFLQPGQRIQKSLCSENYISSFEARNVCRMNFNFAMDQDMDSCSPSSTPHGVARVDSDIVRWQCSQSSCPPLEALLKQSSKSGQDTCEWWLSQSWRDSVMMT